MKLPQFEYSCPHTIEEAISLLAKNDGAKIISGGQSLIPILAFRLSYPPLLVDLKNIPGLNHIRIAKDGIKLGARVRWCDIETCEQLRSVHPLMKEMISHVAHFQIRHRGTVGGSLAHADPSAEMSGLAIVCDCRVVIRGPQGERMVEARDFFTGALETCLAEDEILTEVVFPPWPGERRWAFQEFARRRGDFAMAGVAVFFDLDDDRRAVDAHVGVIGAMSKPCRLASVEDLLNGRRIDGELIEQARRIAAHSVVEPLQDIHASADYRQSLVGTLTARVLRKATEGLQ
jgi:aerobic carbon-monoxide dehydrogenase medium subunit